MAQRLAELYSSVDEVTLRSLFLEVVRVLPESRRTVVDYLRERNTETSLRRTVSLDNLVDDTSGFHVSLPSKSKPKGKKSKIRCNGHNFTCHNYSKPTVCAVCAEVLDGLTHQGYQCKLCLMDVHYRCGGNLEKCRAPQLTKARKLEQKKSKKRRKSNVLGLVRRRVDDETSVDSPRVVKLRDSLVTSVADDEPRLDVPTSELGNLGASSRTSTHEDEAYIVALPETPSKKQPEAGEDQPSEVPPSRLIASPTKRIPHIEIAENDVEDVDADEEVDSSDNSDYYEENSSDAASSDEEENLDTRPSKTFGFTESSLLLTKKRSSRLSMKSLSITSPKVRGKTGASADWKRHGASFRARLTAKHTHSIESLQKFIEDSAAVAKEFGNIPENRVNMLTTPKLTEGKNRYMNILPNNHSRVVLDQVGDDETSCYINANWMKGYGDRVDEFIACQGPLPSTVGDFWRMVWQCKVSTIAMNTGLVELGKEKCERYWPEIADGSDEIAKLTFGDFEIVAYESSQVVPEFKLTKLKCMYNGETRLINHFWWTKWPDKGVPDTTNGIGAFIRAIRDSQENAQGPAIIHCSAGIGRTGCFLTINYCMHQFDSTKEVDILECVGKLRQDRGMTVQTESQYIFIHKVMLKYMQGKLEENEETMQNEDVFKLDHMIDSSRLAVVRSPDRLPASALARKNSTKVTAHKLQMRRSSGNDNAPQLPSGVTREDDIKTVPRSVVAEQAFPHGEHQFRAKTFVRPTECAICHEMLSGLALQGLRCSRCKQDVHFWCLQKVGTSCEMVSNVRRQKSGLPSWPPQRPTKFVSRLTSAENVIEE